MVASCVGDDAPTSSPTETRCARDDAVERRGHIGIAVIDRRDLGVDLGLQQIGLRVVARRGRSIQRRLGNGLPLHQFLLALEVGLGLPQRCLRAGFRGLRLFELQLVGLGLDREQRACLPSRRRRPCN